MIKVIKLSKEIKDLENEKLGSLNNIRNGTLESGKMQSNGTKQKT